MRMELTPEQLAAGLEPGKDLVFPRCPDDPQLRESCSIWLFEDSGAFAFPRVGIEAEASSWDMRRVQGNFAVAGGRILNGAGLGAAHSPFGPDGRPTVLGAGPLAMRCVEPFRRWRASWEGTAVDGTVEQQIAGTLDPARRSAVGFDVELEMVTPAWVQDISPAVVARMSEAERPPEDRRSSFQVAETTSFCAATRSSISPPPPPMPALLCAAVNSCAVGLISRKKMSLRASVERLPRPMSRARA